MLSAQFCCESKTALKLQSIGKKSKEMINRIIFPVEEAEVEMGTLTLLVIHKIIAVIQFLGWVVGP